MGGGIPFRSKFRNVYRLDQARHWVEMNDDDNEQISSRDEVMRRALKLGVRGGGRGDTGRTDAVVFFTVPAGTRYVENLNAGTLTPN